MLENIAAAFSARILLARHAFWFFPTNAYNWSHNLNVQKWTRTQVSSETIQTQIVSSQNKDTSTAAQTNFRFDIDATHALENGWSNSYLLPGVIETEFSTPTFLLSGRSYALNSCVEILSGSLMADRSYFLWMLAVLRI